VRLSRLVKNMIFAPILGACYWLQTCGAPAKLEDLPYNKPQPLWIPTYEGSAQAVHPDILGPEATGGAYVLAFTPYPFSGDRFENPSVLVSSDGLRFREEKKGLNPLVPQPETDHNDDPDISVSCGEYHLLYLETLRPAAQNLVLLRSRDRLHWTRSEVLKYDLHSPHPDPMIVSPALAEKNGKLFLFYVDASAKPNRIEYLTSEELGSFDKGDVRVPSFVGEPITPWHIDVVRGSAEYYMLITDVTRDRSGRSYDLYMARSTDLHTWTMASRKVFPSKPLGAKSVYRSSGYCSGDDIFVYFSCETRLGAWHIGVVRLRLSDLFSGGRGVSQPARQGAPE
jgi:hypothetical protein